MSPLRLGVGVFFAASAALAAALLALGPPAGEPGHPIAEVATGGVVTLDARDPAAWRAFSFALGRVVPEGAAADLLARRHALRAPRGVADLGPIPLDGAKVAPDAVFGEDLGRWYDYRWSTHQLASKGHVYAVRLDGGVAYVQVVSYACAPEGGGCLTLRYRVE